MAKDNLLKPLANWTKSNGGSTTEVTDSFSVSEDGLTASFTITHESSYIYNNVETTEIKGHKLKLSVDSFGSSDGAAWLQIRLYDAAVDSYTSIDKKQADGEFIPGTAFELEVSVPTDCGRIRICLRHEYADKGIDPPATMSVSGISLKDTYTESLTALNFHKVLKENLPASVAAGTQHVYYTTDGVSVEQYISTQEGYLVPVGAASAGSGGSGKTEYYNAYTQQWIDERKAEIIDLTKQGHCIVFAVATDIHVRIEDGDVGRYNQVRDYIMLSKQLPLDYICCCGDIMSYCQDWDEVFEPRIERVKEIFSQARCPWWATRGNHDYNSDDFNPSNNPNILEFDKNSADRLLTTNEVWHRSITSQLPDAANIKVVFDETHPKFGYFYVDDYAKKHRLIFTNSEETHEDSYGRPHFNSAGEPDCFISGVETGHQVKWVVDHAMDMAGKTDWVVSFYSHTAPYTDRGEPDPLEFHGYGGDNPELRQIVKAFQEGTAVTINYGVVDVDTHEWKTIAIHKDFTSQGPIKVIGWFAGHIHDDCYKKVNGLNVFVSTCTCASLRESWSQDPNGTKMGPERNSTNYAMSVNVFVVNTDTRTVHMVKVGSKRDNAVKTSSDIEFTF